MIGKFVIVLIIVIVVGIFGALFFIASGDIVTEYVQNQDIKDNENELIGDQEFESGENGVNLSPEGGGGSSSSSGGGSSSSTSSSSSSSGGTSCITQKLSFAVSNLYPEEVCNSELPPGVCIDKTITCKIDIQNLDGQVGGEFDVEFLYYKINEGIDGTLGVIPSTQYINPGQSKTFTETLNIQSTGSDGDANQETTCTYTITGTPEKEVCE